MMRSQISAFQARGDTTTPMLVSLGAIACNLALKLLLWRDWGAPGLALATASGAWINLATLFVLGLKRGWTTPDPRLLGFFALVGMAALAAGLFAWWFAPLALRLTAGLSFQPLLMGVLAISTAAGVIYAGLAGIGLKATGLFRLLR